jgi:hypothetical protein
MPRQKSAKAILEELRGVYGDSKEYFDSCSEITENFRMRSHVERTTARIIEDLVLRPDRPTWPETKAYRTSKAKTAAIPGPR